MEKKPKKIGVYICHCGGNISDYVDVEKVRQSVEGEDIVFISKTTMFACSDSNQRDMVEDIKANELDGVIVASCSPKLHQLTFRNVSVRADLNKYTYVHANIREQASWAHSDNKMGATEKAIHLVKAAIAKSRYAEALETNKIKAKKAVASQYEVSRKRPYNLRSSKQKKITDTFRKKKFRGIQEPVLNLQSTTQAPLLLTMDGKGSGKRNVG